MYRYNDGDQCPVCDGSLKMKSSEKIVEYKGEKTTLYGFAEFVCTVCGEAFVDEKTIGEYEPRVRDFHRRVDGFLTSSEIKALRKKLNLTQDKLAQVLEVSRLTVSRYETGRLTQSKSQDIHMRMLKDYPEVLKAVDPKTDLNLRAG